MIGTVESGVQIVTNGLVLWLDAAQKRSYSGSGTTWTDLSGSANNGTLTNDPTFNSENGGSIVFDGSNDVVIVPSASSLQPTTGITIEMWLYPTKATDNQVALGKIPNDNSNGWQFPRGLAGWSEVSSFIYFVEDGNFTVLNASWTARNIWTHAVTLYNGTNVQIYLNGSQSASVSRPSRTIATNTADLTIGRRGEAYGGRIGITRIYNRGLSATEVLQNYNAEKSRYPVLV